MSFMDFKSKGHGGHSADVRIRLILNGNSIPVAQLGPGFLLLDVSTNHPPCEGKILLSVDGSERQWAVRLPEGITAETKRVPVLARM